VACYLRISRAESNKIDHKFPLEKSYGLSYDTDVLIDIKTTTFLCFLSCLAFLRPAANWAVSILPWVLHTSQVRSLTANNTFFIEQRATAQSRTGIFRDYGKAEAPPGFQAGWSDCMFIL
jgi:hypothetical protein